jgi:hypothetical protein
MAMPRLLSPSEAAEPLKSAAEDANLPRAGRQRSVHHGPGGATRTEHPDRPVTRKSKQRLRAGRTLKVAGGYRDTKTGIEWYRETKDDGDWIPLTNFSARIVFDIIRDDGVEVTRALEIEATINNRTLRFTVNAAKFGQMTWPLEHLGAEAVVHPGQSSRARTGVQMLSGRIPQRCVYTHTGWREIDGKRVYLHGGGALGSVGPVNGLEVQLPEGLNNYVLPSDISDIDLLRASIDASLDVSQVAPHRITVPLLGAVYRAAIGGADFTVHLSGKTGLQKSELAALAQQHFGPSMNARALPGSWTSSGNALDGTAFAAKDAVFAIDDFVPLGTKADRARINALADRVLRAQGNRSGRARMRSDTTLRPARPPRGLIVSTGEEVPVGQSLRARMINLNLRERDVDLKALTIAQRDAADGKYAYALAGFIKWLAPRLDEVRQDFATTTHELRTRLHSQVHDRTADAVAQLAASWKVWLRFVVAVGACTPEQAARVEATVWQTLAALAGEQQEQQRECDPVERFYELLNSVLASGNAHIASANHPGEPPIHAEEAKALGWRRSDQGSWHPQGPCIGW